MTKILYFAWIRERIGLEEEQVELPADIGTVAALLDWLKGRGEEFAAALEHPEIVRVAVNQQHVEHHESLKDAKEIALFPPMTGG